MNKNKLLCFLGLFNFLFFIFNNTLKCEEHHAKTDNTAKFELNFENAALKNVLDYVTEIFDVTFLPDDAISDEKKIKGVNDVKVTFKTYTPFTEQQVWNFLDLILEIAGLARNEIPEKSKFYRITTIAIANKSNLPTFVGTDPNELPDTERIRYVYFILNKQAKPIQDVLTKLQSKNAQVEIFQELNALILTDSSYNVKSLMQIVKLLDKTELPEVLSVLILKNADATDVAKLYESLKSKEDTFRTFGEAKKTFKITQDTKVIAEPRRNALIIIGPKDTVQRLEKFVTEHIDVQIKKENQKIHTHKLNYVPAEQVANILNSVTGFGAESEAAKFGGIREGERYLTKMHFEADKQGNNLIIRGDIEDYLLVKNVIQQLDQKQPQVAVEVLIVSIALLNNRSINSQIRNKNLGKLNAQTSGFFSQGIQVNSTTGSIVTNLINLAKAATIGSTVLTLGKIDVWAILGILQSTTNISIISNPFLVITNKYKASVSVGETRRTVTQQITGSTSTPTNGIADVEANLTVTITPQINSFGIINLDVDVIFDNFTNPDPNSTNNADKTERRAHTNADVADKEVLALGGLIRTEVDDVEGSVPILGRIPIIGNLFKNKGVFLNKTNLLIFISPRIIKPHPELISDYTKNKSQIIRDTLLEMDENRVPRDPIGRWFFNEEPAKKRIDIINNMIPEESNQNIKIAKREETVSKNNKPKSLLIDSVQCDNGSQCDKGKIND